MIRLAAKTLFFAPRRWWGAVVGVALGGTVMLFQAGIYFGFRASASALIRGIGGDVWVMHRGVRHVDQGRRLPTHTLDLIRTDPCITSVEPVIISYATYERSDGLIDSVQLVGFDASQEARAKRSVELPWNAVAGLPQDLASSFRVSLDVFDSAVIPTPLSPWGGHVRIQGHAAQVAMMTEGIRSPGLTPIMFTNIDAARRLMGWNHHHASFWVVRLNEGCAAALQAKVINDSNLVALPSSTFARQTEDEVVENSGIGGALVFVAALGLIVAMGVVLQMMTHMLHEVRPVIAMLKASGFSSSEVARFVVWQAAFIGALGAVAALATSAALAPLLKGLAIPLSFPRAVWPLAGALLFLTTVLCGAIAARLTYRTSALEALS